MATVIGFTRPMGEFCKFFANGAEVSRVVNLSKCTDFWPKGTNSECLIYVGRQIEYSCCYTEFCNKLYITSVWCEEGCMYQQELNYDELTR